MKLQSFIAAALLLLACESSQNLGNPKPDGSTGGKDGSVADKPGSADVRTGTGGGVAGAGGAGGTAGTSGLGGVAGAGGVTAAGGVGGTAIGPDAGTDAIVGGTGGGAGGQPLEVGAGGAGGLADAARDVPPADAAGGADGTHVDGPGGSGGAPPDVGTGGVALDSGTDETGGAPDAPGAGDAVPSVAALSRFVALPSVGRVQLTWVPPSSPSYAGSLVLRGASPVDATPAAGVSYAAGDDLGGAKVLVSGDTAAYLDTSVSDGTTYYYEAFAFTAGHQYSTGVTASAFPHDLTTSLPLSVGVALQGFSGAIQDVELRYDAATGYHMLVRAGASGANQTVYYAECAASCSSNASWTKTSLATIAANRDAHLALDQQGLPRVVLSGDQRIYRSCVAGCGSEASWSSVTLPVGVGSYAAIAVDQQNQVWVAASGTGVQLAHCASGCTNAANWTVTTAVPVGGTSLNVVDLQVGPGGESALLYSAFVTQYNLQLASCASGCDADAAWSSQPVAGIGGSPIGPAYRLLADGQGARLYTRGGSSGNTTTEYHACDTCAPGLPPLAFDLPSQYVRSFDVNQYGQPRFLLGTDAAGYDLYACDLGCNLSDSWTTTEVLPAFPSGYGYGVLRLQALSGDRPLLIIGDDSGTVELRGGAASGAPPSW